MSSKKTTQGSETVDQVSIEAPDLSPQSNHDSSSDNAQDEQDDISQSDSDSLDSQASRKRRKTSQEPKHKEIPLVTTTSVPSRVKTKSQKTPLDTKNISNGATLAPTDAQTTFAALDVKPWLVGSLGAMAIKRPTGIQKGCIPEILKGRDCIGGSRTGSGKTVAFAVPILQKWAEDPFGIFALVLTPTRELALQIYEQFKAISSPQSLKAVLIRAVRTCDPKQRPLHNDHTLSSQPRADWRIIFEPRAKIQYALLRRVRMVVLDEADRLLASGSVGSMLPDVEECLSILPPPAERQTLLFTATVTPEVRALKDMPRTPGKPPVFVCEVDTQALAIPSSLNQMHLQVPVTHREHYLHMFLLTDKNLPKSVVIFCNRTATADYLTHLLRLLEHRVTALHSKLPQRQRIDNLGRFRASAARILVATDVAARGLDIPEVGLVINYDIPRDPDDYIHRVGRTARAGRKGEAVTFVGQRDVQLVLAIENRVGRQMDAWAEEGVNLETRVIRESLKLVGEKKREAMLEIEEGREVGGKRKRGMKKLS
ncbi:hypothetical protein EYC84_003607 [Monilinia fructicola]|uniref:ATP-dependent RNA helicase DBP8 n=1 Tax=Monilinia fructicola TaxID=38448 RepID=A0A5M9JYW1_MONFR|nr:hypothetical protein EYC84_003607 [Monilinia fructicola]